MQLGQTEVCTDTKPPRGIEHGHDANHGHGHAHLTQTNQVHNHQHPHGVVVGSMQVYGNNMIETFKTEALCQVQCMDCQKVIKIMFHKFSFYISFKKPIIEEERKSF